MDIARPELKHRRRLLRIIYSASGLVIVALVTLGLSRLKAAAPSVDKAAVWTDTVKRLDQCCAKCGGWGRSCRKRFALFRRPRTDVSNNACYCRALR